MKIDINLVVEGKQNTCHSELMVGFPDEIASLAFEDAIEMTRAVLGEMLEKLGAQNKEAQNE